MLLLAHAPLLLLLPLVSARWFSRRQDNSTEGVLGTSEHNSTNTTATNNTAIGYDSGTNICDPAVAHGACCDAYPGADNCPVGPSIDNTNHYDYGAGLRDDYAGGNVSAGNDTGAAAGRVRVGGGGWGVVGVVVVAAVVAGGVGLL